MEQLYDKFANIPALEKEKAMVLNIFEEIASGLQNLSKMGFKLESAKGLNELTTATEKLISTQKELEAAKKKLEQQEQKMNNLLKEQAQARRAGQTGAKQEAETIKELTGELSDNILRQDQLKDRLKKVRAELAGFKDLKASGVNTDQVNNSIKELIETEQKLKIELQATTKFVNNQTKEFIAQDGSLDSLRAKLNQMLQVYDAMSEADKKSPTGKAALESIKGITEEIKKQEYATQRYQRNVGNYEGSAKIIVDALERARQRMTELNKEAGKAGPEARQVRAEYEALSRIVENPNFLQISAKIGDNQQELKAFQKVYQNLDEAGQQSQFGVELKKRLAELQDGIMDARQEIKALSSDTRTFDLFASAVGTAAGVFQAGASAAELLGGSTEQVQKSIQKLMAIQNISNGVRQVANDLTTRGTAANKLYAWTQNLIAIATDKSAIATARWGAALKLIGIGLLIAAISYLIIKLTQVTDHTKEYEKAAEKLNLQLERQKIANDRIVQGLERRLALDIELAKQQGKTQEEINEMIVSGIVSQEKAYERLAKERNESLKQTLDEMGRIGQMDISLYAAMDMGITMEEFQRFRDEGINSLTDVENVIKRIEDHKMSDAFEGFSDDAKAKVERTLTILKSIQEALKQADDKANEAKLKSSQNITEVTAEEKRAAKERADAAARAAEEEKRAALELFKFRAGLIVEQKELEKALDVLPVDNRVQAAKESADAQIAIIKRQRDYELSLEGVAASQRILIREKAAQDILMVEKELADSVFGIRLENERRINEGLQEEYDKAQEAEAARIQARVTQSQKWQESFNMQFEMQASEEREAAAKRFAAGTTDNEEYQAELAAIDVKYSKKRLQNEIDFWSQQVEIMKAAGIDTLALETAIAKARAELAGADIPAIEEANDKKKELLDELKQKYQELATTILDTAQAIIGGAFDAKKARIQDEMDLIDEWKAKEIDRINATTDSEEKKAAKVKLIEAKAQSDKEALERRQRQLDLKKALFDRAFKAYGIITQGIQSVATIKLKVAELTADAIKNPFLLPLIPLAAAQIPFAINATAAQLIGLLATPLPRYAKGVDWSPAGKALVGEAGAELAYERPTRTWKLYDGPTIADLKAGTKIFPAHATRQFLSSTSVTNVTQKPTYVAPDRTDEVVVELKEIKKKTGTKIIIYNNSAIETSAYYLQQMKY